MAQRSLSAARHLKVIEAVRISGCGRLESRIKWIGRLSDFSAFEVYGTEQNTSSKILHHDF